MKDKLKDKSFDSIETQLKASKIAVDTVTKTVEALVKVSEIAVEQYEQIEALESLMDEGTEEVRSVEDVKEGFVNIIKQSLYSHSSDYDVLLTETKTAKIFYEALQKALEAT